MFCFKIPISPIIDKWDYTELKQFLHSKKIIGRMNRQSKEWEKIFASYISGRVNV